LKKRRGKRISGLNKGESSSNRGVFLQVPSKWDKTRTQETLEKRGPGEHRLHRARIHVREVRSLALEFWLFNAGDPAEKTKEKD